MNNDIQKKLSEIDHRRSPQEYIIALARSFKCLSTKVEDLTPETWDAEAFLNSVEGWSPSELYAAQFIVGVWSGPGSSWPKENAFEFDAISAISHWSDANRSAFVAWVADPKFP